MILTWLNLNTGRIYTKFYNSYYFNNYYVGFINSYNHEIIQILILRDNRIFNVSNYNDYISKSSIPISKFNKLLTFLKMLI